MLIGISTVSYIAIKIQSTPSCYKLVDKECRVHPLRPHVRRHSSVGLQHVCAPHVCHATYISMRALHVRTCISTSYAYDSYAPNKCTTDTVQTHTTTPLKPQHDTSAIFHSPDLQGGLVATLTSHSMPTLPTPWDSGNHLIEGAGKNELEGISRLEREDGVRVAIDLRIMACQVLNSDQLARTRITDDAPCVPIVRIP